MWHHYAGPPGRVSPSRVLEPHASTSRRTHEAIGVEVGDHGHGMVVDVIGVGAPAAKGVHIRVVAPDQDPRGHLAQARGQQLERPEDTILGRPCLLRMTVETVHQDDAMLAVRLISLLK